MTKHGPGNGQYDPIRIWLCLCNCALSLLVSMVVTQVKELQSNVIQT